MKKIIGLFISILLLSCSMTVTKKAHISKANEQINMRNLEGAINTIKAEKEISYKQKDRVLYYLDLGLLYHYNGDYQKSNELLTKAERAIDELFTKSVSRIASSMILNDNVLEYYGEDYEDIYLNVIMALNYINLDKFDDAFVEIRKINNKLAVLEDKYTKMSAGINSNKKNKAKAKIGKSNFHSSVLGSYLSLLMYLADDQVDDANIDLKRIDDNWETQSNIYLFKKPNLKSEFTTDNKVNFVTLIGKSPDKKARTYRLHTEKDHIFVSYSGEDKKGREELKGIESIYWPGIDKSYHFKLELPYIYKTKSRVSKVKIFVDGEYKKDLDLIEDIGKVAEETFKVKAPIIYFKSIARTVLKGIINEKAKEKIDKEVQNPLLAFTSKLATDVATDLSENSDLRISHFFPQKVMVGNVDIQPGEHNIELKYFDKNNVMIYSDLKENVTIDQDFNLIESFYLK